MAAPYDDIATAIVQGQSKVMGAGAACDVARGVPGTTVGADGTTSVAAGAGTIDAMVKKFTDVSGPLGERICFMAAKPVLTQNPGVTIPSFARF